ncbi:molybdopterin-guanine dinucleotide biosynthesis protein A [Lysinibacillus composti]|uniref:Probable molybdenum cofactor guanylyltransferase n=1 Tax=Lysinibacillus composti TaxID=720633 RepID=A0A3N9UTC7_9BACI|nr:molybdenum cofactor guanylyltransferase [Lysinibacillus composti]MBM7607745.1 molybdopterin-guanine dinucleotide biosynthesis protein A [Lysinibacillus composti]RQW75762.1 molybdenum cofactor guanylyltransferase [Lysinibacillus composti]
MKIAGVVLAGGQSSRYGQPKMFELFNGQPLYKNSLIALQKNQLQPLIIATNANLESKFVEDQIEMIIEKQPHQGPLSALQNILANFQNVEWFFIVASDMPYMNVDFVQTMLTYIDDRYDAIVPKQASRIQPLAALYRRSALPKANLLLQQNKRSMKVLLEQLRVRYVEFEEECSTFVNINTQLDWSQLDKKESTYE